jgi:hypothetical protein
VCSPRDGFIAFIFRLVIRIIVVVVVVPFARPRIFGRVAGDAEDEDARLVQIGQPGRVTVT